jgi:hypothetical protein
LPIGISSSYQVVVIVTAVFPLLATISATTRIIFRLIIVFIVAALSWSSHVVLAISPAVGDLH